MREQDLINMFTSFCIERLELDETSVSFNVMTLKNTPWQLIQAGVLGYARPKGLDSSGYAEGMCVCVRFGVEWEYVCFTIAHELAHVQQAQRKRLKYDTAQGLTWFDGELFSNADPRSNCENHANETAHWLCEEFAKTAVAA